MKTEEILALAKGLLPATTNKGLVDGMDMIHCINGDFITYNDKIAMSFIAPEGLDNFSVIAADFISALEAVTTEDVDIKTENGIVQIISKNDVQAELNNWEDTTVLEYVNSLDYKNTEEIEWFDLPGDFIEAINLCGFSTSTNVNNTQLLFCVYTNKTYILGTDKHRVSIYKNKEWDLPEILIPYYNIPHIKNMEPDGYFLGNGWIHFINSMDVILSCRIYSVKKTNALFKEVAKMTTELKFKDNIKLPKETINTLDSMLQFSDELNSADKNVVLEFKKNKLVCRAEKQTGVLKKTLKIEKHSLECSLNFRTMFLKDILQKADTINIGESTIRIKTKNFTHILSQQYTTK